MNRINNTVLATTLASVVIATAGSAFAGSGSSDIERREVNQRARIETGVRDGSLSRREAAYLVREQRDIERLERRAKSDGVITARERAEIKMAQDKADRDIYNLRHNSERRGHRWRWW